MDLMKFGWIDPRKGLELMEVGGINKVYEQFQRDEKQAQRENMRMSKITPDDLQQHSETQQALAQIDPQTGEPTNPDFRDPQTGQPLNPPLIVPVNTWDDHNTHIEVHNNFRKSQSFELLPEELKSLFEAHVQDHKAAQMNDAMEQAQQMQISAPPGSKGGPDNQAGPTSGPPVGPPPPGGDNMNMMMPPMPGG
jgi:hypothetical protein